MKSQSIYAQLATLFEYPGENYVSRAKQCAERVSREQQGSAALEEFCAAIDGKSSDELQELFTQTFDLNPVCTLEIGWHLYGEDYQRGEFLVKMRQQLRTHEVKESQELPDHLTHALQLLASMEDEEAAAFAGQFLLPALDKMRSGWRDNRNAFAALLDSTFALLKSHYHFEPVQPLRTVPALRVLR